MHADLQETNWVPHSFQEAARNLAKKTVKYFVRPNQVIGLGSAPMAASIVREMANFDGKETRVYPHFVSDKIGSSMQRAKTS
jgi:ribose 5-phosphate isomerase